MTWLEYHRQSEQFAGEAEMAERKGEIDRARELYRQAAELEENALSVLDRQKVRTLGITAVSAAALWFKAGKFEIARKIAEEWLAGGMLPPFAINGLVELSKTIELALSNDPPHYQVRIWWDSDDQAFLAQAPELPGCVVDGATRLEAVANLETAIREWLETARKLNRAIPQPEDQHALV